MKNSKLKNLLKSKVALSEKSSNDITFLNDEQLNQIGGGSCGGTNTCGVFGAKKTCGANSCGVNG